MTTTTRAPRSSKKTGQVLPAKRARKERPTRAATNDRSTLAGSTHVTPAGGNVFADLGFSSDEAENLKVRAQLMDAVRRLIAARGLTQAQAGILFGVAQPRISDLMRGKIALFTIDALVNMLAHARVGVSVSLAPSAA